MSQNILPSENNVSLITRNDNSLRYSSYNFGDTISLDSENFELRSNGISLLGSKLSKIIVFEDIIDVKEGVILIRTTKPIQLPVLNKNIEIPTDSIIIYDSVQKIIVNLSRKSILKINNFELAQNQLLDINQESDGKVLPFDRTELTRREEYKNLSLTTKVFEQEIPELTDTIPPRLIKINPSSGEETNNPELRITGSTEISTQVKINGSLIAIDKLGNFGTKIFLVEGENKIYLDLTDVYGNSSEIILNYTLIQ
jgi:hypothetical protein